MTLALNRRKGGWPLPGSTTTVEVYAWNLYKHDAERAASCCWPASIADAHGITVALIELTLGVLVGNAFDLHSQQWLDFIAAFASVVLTFLAGMEVDPDYMRDRAKATVGIGIASFAARSRFDPAWLLTCWTAARACG